MSERKTLRSVFEKLKNNGKIQIAVLIIISAFLFIYFFAEGNRDNTSVSENDSVSEYVLSLEKKLQNILSEVEGAGKVSVAIRVESGMETVLATSTTTKETSNGREIVTAPITVNGKTVVLKENYPKITGVIVVSEGANDLRVYQKIQQATTSLLNIEVSRLEILAMK